MIYDDAAEQKVSADAFDLFYTIIGLRLKYGRLTVADATHLSAKFRRRLINIARGYSRDIYLVMFDATLDQCLRHNKMRKRQVDRSVTETHVEAYGQAKSQINEEQAEYAEVYELRPSQIDHVTIELVDQARSGPD